MIKGNLENSLWGSSFTSHSSRWWGISTLGFYKMREAGDFAYSLCTLPTRVDWRVFFRSHLGRLVGDGLGPMLAFPHGVYDTVADSQETRAEATLSCKTHRWKSPTPWVSHCSHRSALINMGEPCPKAWIPDYKDHWELSWKVITLLPSPSSPNPPESDQYSCFHAWQSQGEFMQKTV